MSVLNFYFIRTFTHTHTHTYKREIESGSGGKERLIELFY